MSNKSLHRIVSFIAAGMVLSGAWSCTEKGPAGQDKDGMVEISFSAEVDGVELDVKPFETKAGEGEKTYYFIKIDDISSRTDRYQADGLFDSFGDNVKLQLPTGRDYKFSMLVIRETEFGHLVPYSDGRFGAPFAGRVLVDLTNQFRVHNSTAVTHSALCEDDNHSGYNSFVYRYVGYKTVENLQNGGKISIPLKNYFFAVNMTVTPPLDGSLEISIADFGLNATLAAGDAPLSLSRIVNSRQEATEDAADEYSEEHEVEIKWNRDPVLTSYDVKKTISFTKGMQHNISVNLNDRAGFTGFDPQLVQGSSLPETSFVID